MTVREGFTGCDIGLRPYRKSVLLEKIKPWEGDSRPWGAGGMGEQRACVHRAVSMGGRVAMQDPVCLPWGREARKVWGGAELKLGVYLGKQPGVLWSVVRQAR